MNPSYYDLEETSSAAINVFLSRYYSISGSLFALCSLRCLCDVGSWR